MSLAVGIAILAFAIVLGGFAAVWHHRARKAMPAIRTFAVVAAASIALLHLLPEAIEAAGWAALLAAAAGALGPSLLERAMSPSHERPHDAPTTALAMGYAAVIAHQAGEGATVATLAATGALSATIILAIAAHTTPLSMVVAMRVMELEGGNGRRGRAIGLALLGVAGATVAGALAGNLMGEERLEAIEPWLLATIAGLLLHALAHDAFPVAPEGTPARIGDATAGLIGLGLAVVGVEEGGWIEAVPRPVQIAGVLLVAGAIVARSFWGSRPRGHAH